MDKSNILPKKIPFINIKTVVKSCVVTHKRQRCLKGGNTVPADGVI